MYEGYRASIAILTEGLDVARRRGALRDELDYRMAITWASLSAGEWDRVLDDAVVVEPLLESAAMVWALGIVRLCRTLVLVGRGRTAEAGELATRVRDRALVETGHTLAACCIAAAAARMAMGDSVAALQLLADSEAPLRGKGGYWWADCLPLAVRTALAGGDSALAERLSESIKPLQPLSRHGIAACQSILAEARGDHEAAAHGFAAVALRWHDFGMPYEEAQALLGQGRCLVALGRAPEAAAPLAEAHAIFERLGAKPALAETDELIDQVASA
jgi:ATP/maltotriose-dependent transcriptional regulator MalT